MNKGQNSIKIRFVMLLVFAGAGIIVSAQQSKNPTRETVLEAMRTASDYMVSEVSCNGGYLHFYSEDFSEQWGEVTARKSQIWIQRSTPRMGELFLELYQSTGDKTYLEHAKKTANALVWGQHPLGGWHYWIDFDESGVEEWYRTISSQVYRGMEEHRHYYGNCTFDDNVTQGATTFLLHLYMETLDPVWYGPLKKALDFVLMAQYPNGGWPQRYPLADDYSHDGFDDYTSNYTLNDDAMNTTMNLLIEAYEKLGNEEYLKSAKRGGDFFMISQGPEEIPAWSEQFDMKLRPDWGRTHEPPAFGTRQTAHTVEMLMRLALYTRDKRYLRPVPATLEWIESSKMGVLEDGKYDLARYYDPETRLPIDFYILDEVSPDGYCIFHYFANGDIPFPGRRQSVDYDHLKKTYDLITGVAPGEEEELYDQLYRQTGSNKKPDSDEVLDLLNTRNENGIWIEDISVFDTSLTMIPLIDNRKVIQGISTKSWLQNMRVFLDYIQN